MKINIVFICFLLVSINSLSQENMVTISGGYAFANVGAIESNATGWRINGLFEFNPSGGMLAHGLSFGYFNLQATEGVGSQTIESKLFTTPLYYSPKVMFGSEKIKAFVKGALGMQFAGLQREGLITLDDTDFGFYGGGGGGIMFFIQENIFINAEYEIVWTSNDCYKDGWMNTAMAGIGFKF